ncbi:zinc-binding CMP/dCMP deaminase [Absidia repens]|uniref:Zinc-binding CMP/dCMP deaminase n=1 Tax=Absidia repens TaxID=90262 RepID=A0A1X2IVF5_9FUNG|nr:zinc-binding CMP/dCMP deaminase [Absidia repens]
MTFTHEDHIKFLRQSIKVATRAKSLGGHPFGAVLIGPDKEFLGDQGNINVMNHAENVLAQTAYNNYPAEFLEKCTMYASFEPCCMCAGSCYWAGIGTVVYGMSEDRLLKLTGSSGANPTMSLPCRDVFAAGQRKVKVLGPFPELEEEIAKDHHGFWN